MDALEKLRQIGIKKINTETRISIGVIDNILQKRFDKIQRVWIVGFLPILEREYDVDLSQWLEEYDAYHLEHQEAMTNDTYKIRELELDTQKQKYDNFKKSISSSALKQIIVVTFGICCVIVVFILLKLYTFSDSSSWEYSIVEKPFEADDGVKNQGIYNNIATTDQNTSIGEKKNSSIDIDKIIASNEIEVKDGEVLIIPKGELWFQILNLETKQKQDRTIRDPYLLKIPSQKSVVIFGHKGFDLKYKNKLQKYDGGDPIRFVTENNSLKYIRYAEYLKLLGVEKKESVSNTNANQEAVMTQDEDNQQEVSNNNDTQEETQQDLQNNKTDSTETQEEHVQED